MIRKRDDNKIVAYVKRQENKGDWVHVTLLAIYIKEKFDIKSTNSAIRIISTLVKNGRLIRIGGKRMYVGTKKHNVFS